MKRNETERERRCLVTVDTGPVHDLLRFVIAPDGALVPDLRVELPGRGYWVGAHYGLIDRAVKKHAFERAVARAHKGGDAASPPPPPLSIDPKLADRVGDLMVKNTLNLLGMARRAGLVFTGYEKAKATLAARPDAVLVAAADGSPDGRRKLARRDRVVIDLFDRDTLSAALGKENAVHAAVLPDGLGARFITEAKRLIAYRQAPSVTQTVSAKPRAKGTRTSDSKRVPGSGKVFVPRRPRTTKLGKGKATSHE